MTLVLTDISQYGIVMGADAADTMETRLPGGKKGLRVLNGVKKLFPLPHLKAGISCWGHGEIGDLMTDIWLSHFIERHQDRSKTLQEFAIQLQDELNRTIPPTQSGEAEAGFHLAGFVSRDGRRTPDLWHIHNGASQFFGNIDPHVFNANHDLAAATSKGVYSPGRPNFILRNGDYEFYAAWWKDFESLLNRTLRLRHVHIPRPSLEGRAEYIRFQIRTIGEIYAMSTRLPSIGGETSILTIDDIGIRYYQSAALSSWGPGTESR